MERTEMDKHIEQLLGKFKNPLNREKFQKLSRNAQEGLVRIALMSGELKASDKS